MEGKGDNTGSSSKASLDSEKSALEKFEADAKNMLFGVLFTVLKDEEISIWLTFLFGAIQFFQILIFPFNSQITDVWNYNSVAEGLNTFLEYFQLVNYFKTTNWNVYIMVFYILFAVVAIVILCFVYVSYSYSKKKFAFMWPLYALRATLYLFTTILYLPILDLFMSLVRCTSNGQGVQVHVFFTEIQCWTGAHLIHSIMAMIISLTYAFICLTVVLTYFESRPESQHPEARVHARGNFVWILYQTVMVVLFSFLQGHQYDYILLIVMLAGSLLLFSKLYVDAPYYDEKIGKMWRVIIALNLWSALMIFFAKLMESSMFDGSMMAWIIGCPFIALIVLTNRDHRIELLLTNVNKFQNSEMVRNQARYLLKLLDWQVTSRNAAILLDGYIEIHNQTCNKDDCPLRQILKKNFIKQHAKTTTSKGEGLRSSEAGQEVLNAKYALLIELIGKMLFQGIKKFPNDTSLRIQYAFFLLDKKKHKQEALQELIQAEQYKPPLDEQFIIYRYKKLIEDQIAESQNEGGGLDIVSESAFQAHLRQCTANIEKSALLHMEFWSQLSEDNPDLAKLNDIGSKINNSVLQVEDHWNKLLKISTNQPKAIRLYGRFLIEILNDKEGGEALLDRARKLVAANLNKRNMIMNNVNNSEEYINDPTPTVFLTTEQEKFGVITGINLAAAQLFGYNKTELINRKINTLMPPIYGKRHDTFLNNYLQSGEPRMMNRERMVMGKHKTNYIFPVYLSLRPLNNVGGAGAQFIGNFKIEKSFKQQCWVLINDDGSIDGITSSCLPILKIELKNLNQKRQNINDMFPNFMRDIDIYKVKQGAPINYMIPEESETPQQGGSTKEETTITLNCSVVEIPVMNGERVVENAGFMVKFERNFHNASMSLQPQVRRPAGGNSNFQFRYDRGRIYLGEFVDILNSEVASQAIDESAMPEEIDKSGIMSEDVAELDKSADKSMAKSSVMAPTINITKEIAKPIMKEPVKEGSSDEKIDYAAGIRTLRLLNGRPMEIEQQELDDDNDEDNSAQQQSVFRQNQQDDIMDGGEDFSQREFSSTFKSRKMMNQVISDKAQPPAIRNLKIVANLIVLALFVIAAVDYALTISEFNDIQDNVNLIVLSNNEVADMMLVLRRVSDLKLLAAGVFLDPTGALETSFRNDIAAALAEIESIQASLQLSSTSLLSAHDNLLNTPSVNVYMLQNSQRTTLQFTLNEATQQIITKAHNVQTDTLRNITANNTDVYFVEYNLLNDYYKALRQSADYYVQELADRSVSKQDVFLIILIISAVILFVAIIILIPVLASVNSTREEVLALFLDIPEKTVKVLYSRCENFISTLQVGEEDDVISEAEEESFDRGGDGEMDESSAEYQPRKKRKRFKNSGKSQRSFYLKLLIVAGVIEAYFIYNYFLAQGLLNDMNQLVPEINVTAIAEGYSAFVSVAERQLLWDGTFPVLGQTSLTVSTNNIQNLYQLDSNINQYHSINVGIHSDRYKNDFNTIMMLNPCPIFVANVTAAQCAAFADGAVFQGVAVSITRYFEDLRYILTQYVTYSGNPNLAWAGGNSSYYTNISSSMQRNNILSLLNVNQSAEIDVMQNLYIKTAFRYLMDSFSNGLSDTYNSNLTIRLALFVVFNIVLAALYLVIWLPFVSRLNKNIWRTKSMLTMIPISVVANIRSVRVYLRKILNEKNMTTY